MDNDYPKSSVILFGPEGCGKAEKAEAIAKMYGLPNIAPDFHLVPALPIRGEFDTLYLYHVEEFENGVQRICDSALNLRWVSFDDALQQLKREGL